MLGDVVQCGSLFGNVVQYKAEELITLSQNISPLATLLGDVVHTMWYNIGGCGTMWYTVGECGTI